MSNQRRVKNLKPWKPGQTGNPGGRPKRKLLSNELERLLETEAPKGKGKTWATVIAEALVKRASKGDVRAIAEIGNRIEGRPAQAVELDANVNADIVERLESARARLYAGMTDEELDAKIQELTRQLGLRSIEAEPQAEG